MVKKPKLKNKDLCPKQLHKYLSGLPNWELTGSDLVKTQTNIGQGKYPYSFEGKMDFGETRKCEFVREEIPKEILDEIEVKQMFETIYLAKVKSSEYRRNSYETPYPDQKFFQITLEKHLEKSALRQIAKKHSLYVQIRTKVVEVEADEELNIQSAQNPKYGVKESYTRGGKLRFKLSCKYLSLEGLIFSPKDIGSISQAIQEYDDLLQTEQYQDMAKNIQREIEKDLKEIVNEESLLKIKNRQKMRDKHLSHYLNKLPNWKFIWEDSSANLMKDQKKIMEEEDSCAFKGEIELVKKWYCEFGHKDISENILDKITSKQRFKTIYSAIGQMSKWEEHHFDESCVNPEFFQQIYGEYLQRSALSQVAKRYSLNVKRHKKCIKKNVRDGIYTDTNLTCLSLERLIFSPKEVYSLFQAIQEYDNLLQTKKYQNMVKNLTGKIEEDLKKKIGEGKYQK